MNGWQTVGDYLTQAKMSYVKHGRARHEQAGVKSAIRILVDNYGKAPATGCQPRIWLGQKHRGILRQDDCIRFAAQLT